MDTSTKEDACYGVDGQWLAGLCVMKSVPKGHGIAQEIEVSE
jgi:hypothetical protein